MSKEKIPTWKNDSEQAIHLQLMHMFNWFTYNKSRDDAEKYFKNYCMSKHGQAPHSKYELKFQGFGWLSKILDANPHAYLGDYQQRLDNEAEMACKEIAIKTTKTEGDSTKPSSGPVQKNIDAQCRELYGEIEAQLDHFISKKFKSEFDTDKWLCDAQVKDIHCKKLGEYLKKQIAKFQSYLSDPELFDGVGFSKSEIKKTIKYLSSIDAIVNENFLKLQKIKNINMMPRKKKPRPASKQVEKMEFLANYSCLKSIFPTNMIGAQEVWIYNTKREKLGVYYAENREGLQAKGKSLFNFDASKSACKRLPVKKFNLIVENITADLGKIKRRKFLEKIKNAEQSMTGRIDANTLILFAE